MFVHILLFGLGLCFLIAFWGMGTLSIWCALSLCHMSYVFPIGYWHKYFKLYLKNSQSSRFRFEVARFIGIILMTPICGAVAFLLCGRQPTELVFALIFQVIYSVASLGSLAPLFQFLLEDKR